jgi:dynein heavy chain, axonemal
VFVQVKDPDSGQMVMDFWETAKKMMTDSNFLDSLKSFDKDNIDPEIIKKLQPIITRDEFEPKKVLKVSKAAFGLASWVKAMDSYHRVAKVVGPKKAALAEAEMQLKVRHTHVQAVDHCIANASNCSFM